ncbi:class I SAM-dependent DNA methyltransferase [Gellertiella hungarica]|uniref:SAM-dependent methyltransferase n=1 Tax=Gellertiella hungarica TaxID=1572859 RepID=A0A7W6NL78_9HYPH|nr:class I SAM-dependent methyltransferase [Gellertiella hungarica]MBB4065289.1 SAM-dependent methyltransferase [Gellertiella hungarica]
MSGRMSEGLEKVYAARATDELAEAYSAWADDYDRETLSLGYCLPFVITAFIARYVPRKDSLLLDAGCGTGLTGPYLAALGYSRLAGLDMAPDMLAIARNRGCYADLTVGVLGNPLPFADEQFTAVFSTGVFTEGHAPASSISELARIVRAGGHLIFTVRDSILEKNGFGREIETLVGSRDWTSVEESPLFRAFAIAEPDVLVKAFVFQRSMA